MPAAGPPEMLSGRPASTGNGVMPCEGGWRRLCMSWIGAVLELMGAVVGID